MEELNRQQTTSALAPWGSTIFPRMLLHSDVGRQASIQTLDESMVSGQPIFLVAQRELAVESPQEKDLYSTRTICNVCQIPRLSRDNAWVVVGGISRGRLCLLSKTMPYLNVLVEELPVEQPVRRSARTKAPIRQAYELFERFTELALKTTPDVLLSVFSSEDPDYIADYIAQDLSMRTGDRWVILEEPQPVRRLERLRQSLRQEVEILELEQEMQGRVREQLTRSQRDYALREQLKVLQQELGEEGTGGDNEITEYRQRIVKARLSQGVADKLTKEVGRLEKQPFGSAEATVLCNYLDTVLELPRGKYAKERVNVEAARRVLDVDHYGLERVKERILESLAVRQLAPGLKGQILCLVGPPDAGKTSIAMGMARVLNRKLARTSPGGAHNEAEIRGHRKTYVGATSGRIIAVVRQTESCNPLLLLDETDRLGNDQRGNPASTPLEVLDAEQNSTFRDHFLEVPFDLSGVLFITTANTLDIILRSLLDRMEVIELTSYTDEEKLQTAERHLLPKELKYHGLAKAQLRLTDDAIRELTRGYTRRAGVRVLEQKLGTLCRKAAMDIVSNGVKSIHITGDNLEDYLGTHRYHPEWLPRMEQVGMVDGLAWAQVGGEILEVEVGVVSGSGRVELTGSLDSVMKGSAQAVLSYTRSRAVQLGIGADFYKMKDTHIHFPEGVVPRDGLSVGVAIITAMVPALAGASVRWETAMTGEVTLRGRVLPIGGLKEKTMTVYRSGIKIVFLPADNVPDLEEIDPTVRAALHFVPVERVDPVLTEALELETYDSLRDDVLPPPEFGSRSQEVPTFRQ